MVRAVHSAVCGCVSAVTGLCNLQLLRVAHMWYFCCGVTAAAVALITVVALGAAVALYAVVAPKVALVRYCGTIGPI